MPLASLLIAATAFIACAQDGNHCGQVRYPPIRRPGRRSSVTGGKSSPWLSSARSSTGTGHRNWTPEHPTPEVTCQTIDPGRAARQHAHRPRRRSTRPALRDRIYLNGRLVLTCTAFHPGPGRAGSGWAGRGSTIGLGGSGTRLPDRPPPLGQPFPGRGFNGDGDRGDQRADDRNDSRAAWRGGTRRVISLPTLPHGAALNGPSAVLWSRTARRGSRSRGPGCR
jgi:hypothetical protein